MTKYYQDVNRNKAIILNVAFIAIIFSFHITNSYSGESYMDNNKSKNYHFEMTKGDQDIFLKKVKQIKLGESIQQVKTVLGKPTHEQKLVGKKGEFIAIELSYYIKMFEKDIVNEKFDRLVRFVFNGENQLIKIESNDK